MQLGMIGLGKMGANMVRRIMRGGHQCVVFDQTPTNIEELENEGATGASSLEELVSKLDAPRAVWIMVPSGEITEGVVQELAGLLAKGDIMIDGGNSMFKDDARRAAELVPKGIRYLDCGTSGGVWGLARGYCLMIGGDDDAVDRRQDAHGAGGKTSQHGNDLGGGVSD